MKTLIIWVCLTTLLCAGAIQAVEGSSETPAAVPPAGRSIQEFVTPDGRLDLNAVRASGYQGPQDLKGFETAIDPMNQAPVVRPSVSSTAASTREDMYWDNSISPSLHGTGGPVFALTVYNGNLIAGGGFTWADAVAASCIASWDGTAWSPLGSGMNSSVTALTVYNNNLIAGGLFTTAGGTSANYIASWDGSTWSPLGSGMDGFVDALTVYNGNLIAGGSFTKAGGVDANLVAAWDGTAWSQLGSGVNGYLVSALTVYNGNLIAGGGFWAAGGVKASHIASWDGSTWSPLDAGTGDLVYALAVYNGSLIAGGWFTTAGRKAASRIASWDGSEWSPLGLGVNKWNNGGYDPCVYALTAYDGNLIAGGSFTTAGEVIANYIASWDGYTWSQLGSGMCCYYPFVWALTIYNGSLIAGGGFSTAGNKASEFLARWTKHSPLVTTTSIDIRPGVCPNPLYGRDLCRGKSVIPVAVLGNAEFNVSEIDPSSVTLCGVRALEWSLLDVSTPADKTKDSCACSTDGPDGYPDLLLKFEQCAIESAIKPPPPSPPGTGVEVAKLAVGTGDLTVPSTRFSEEPAKPPLVLTLHGMLEDGSPIIGYDCLELSDKVTPAIGPIDEPQQAGLRGNYPNPFNPTTTIAYSVPTRSHVVIELFNIVGQRIRTLVDETKPSGVYEAVWNGTNDAGEPVSSGVYLYRLRAGDFIETKKMVLLK